MRYNPETDRARMAHDVASVHNAATDNDWAYKLLSKNQDVMSFIYIHPQLKHDITLHLAKLTDGTVESQLMIRTDWGWYLVDDQVDPTELFAMATHRFGLDSRFRQDNESDEVTIDLTVLEGERS